MSRLYGPSRPIRARASTTRVETMQQSKTMYQIKLHAHGTWNVPATFLQSDLWKVAQKNPAVWRCQQA